jgi:cyclopropane fatty-acyl-phospholipid synthase-like methyltransferase
MKELTLDKLPEKVLKRLDVETMFGASRTIIAAERLLVFRQLHGKELSAPEVGRRTGMHRKYCESFLDFLVFLGLLRKKANRYRNSALAEEHFIQDRTIEWTRFWPKYCASDFEALTGMERVLTSEKDWRQVLKKDRKTDYELVREDAEWAREFTLALYHENKPVAQMVANKLDLSEYQSLLDVGGGSGVMSIALVRTHPQLTACILDFKNVCDTADTIIRRECLSDRVATLAGDMNRSIPSGFDVMMFWGIGHIDTKVMRMAYKSLPKGGMVVRSCTPVSNPKAPSPNAFLREYLSVMPLGQTKSSIMSSLKKAGFGVLKSRKIEKGLGMITGHKR